MPLLGIMDDAAADRPDTIQTASKGISLSDKREGWVRLIRPRKKHAAKQPVGEWMSPTSGGLPQLIL